MQHVDDTGAQGGKGKATPDDHHIFPFHLLPGIPVSQGAPNAHDIPFFHVVKMGGDQPHLVHRKAYKPFLRGRGCDADGNFTLSRYRQLRKLPGSVGKLLFIFRVEKHKSEGLKVPVLGFCNDFLDTNRDRVNTDFPMKHLLLK